MGPPSRLGAVTPLRVVIPLAPHRAAGMLWPSPARWAPWRGPLAPGGGGCGRRPSQLSKRYRSLPSAADQLSMAGDGRAPPRWGDLGRLTDEQRLILQRRDRDLLGSNAVALQPEVFVPATSPDDDPEGHRWQTAELAQAAASVEALEAATEAHRDSVETLLQAASAAARSDPLDISPSGNDDERHDDEHGRSASPRATTGEYLSSGFDERRSENLRKLAILLGDDLLTRLGGREGLRAVLTSPGPALILVDASAPVSRICVRAQLNAVVGRAAPASSSPPPWLVDL